MIMKGEVAIGKVERCKANGKFWLNMRIRENMLIQKVRMRWLNEGGVNSKFFHKVMKKGLRRNFI